MKTSINIRISPESYAQIKHIALENKCSINDSIELLLLKNEKLTFYEMLTKDFEQLSKDPKNHHEYSEENKAWQTFYDNTL